MRAGSRVARFLPLLAALGLASWLSRHSARDQTVHYVLGDSASRVERVQARWAENDRQADAQDWIRMVTFRYAPGQAPRVLTHEPRVADGEYTLQIEIDESPGDGRDRRVEADGAGGRARVVRRHVLVNGGVTSVDLDTRERAAQVTR